MKLDKEFDISIKTLGGVENVLVDELFDLGYRNIEKGKRIARVRGGLEDIYKLNHELRTALKILIPVHTFKATNEQNLYDALVQYDWGQFIHPDQTLAIDPVINSEYFRHSRFIAQKAKDAIVDQLRKKFHRRPSVDLQDPDVRLNLHIWNDTCTVSLDSSGESLHKRGYKIFLGQAPLNEVLAAGILKIAGWKPGETLYDPMCGSGTISIEAAMIDKNIAPGKYRQQFGFQKWLGYDDQLFKSVCALKQTRGQASSTYHVSDISNRSLEQARKNAMNAGVHSLMKFSTRDFFSLKPEKGGGVVILNPPYGERLKDFNVVEHYRGIGDTLKNNFQGFKAWVFTSNIEAVKYIGLRPSKKIKLYNGPLECKLLAFDIYEGSKKTLKKHDKDS